MFTGENGRHWPVIANAALSIYSSLTSGLWTSGPVFARAVQCGAKEVGP
jgi:hypothetical protein